MLFFSSRTPTPNHLERFSLLARLSHGTCIINELGRRLRVLPDRVQECIRIESSCVQVVGRATSPAPFLAYYEAPVPGVALVMMSPKSSQRECGTNGLEADIWIMRSAGHGGIWFARGVVLRCPQPLHHLHSRTERNATLNRGLDNHDLKISFVATLFTNFVFPHYTIALPTLCICLQ